jgi:hypothetical protein
MWNNPNRQNVLPGYQRSSQCVGTADILGVIGHAHEIERLSDFDLVTGWMLDWLAERILVRILRAS